MANLNQVESAIAAITIMHESDVANSPDRVRVGERLLTAVQVAELLAVPKTRIWSMSRRGEIPTVRIGARDVRYRPEDIDAWIARRTTSRPRGTQS